VRRLIVSDLHANWEALQAVLEDAEGAYGEIFCCGDIVGYGASPVEVIDWSRNALTKVVRGNHDKACCGLDDLEWFNDAAARAANWTMAEIGAEGQAYLLSLPQGPLREEHFLVAHGSPLDEDEYLVNDIDVAGFETALELPLNFIGHTHLQGGWVWGYGGHRRIPKPGLKDMEVVLELRPDHIYLINPGSVGQPRDNDARAAYVIWDSDEKLIRFRRVKYDVKSAMKRIRAARLPDVLADRLLVGR